MNIEYCRGGGGGNYRGSRGGNNGNKTNANVTRTSESTPNSYSAAITNSTSSK